MYLKIFPKFIGERPRQPPKHKSKNSFIQKLIFTLTFGLNFHLITFEQLQRITRGRKRKAGIESTSFTTHGVSGESRPSDKRRGKEASHPDPEIRSGGEGGGGGGSQIFLSKNKGKAGPTPGPTTGCGYCFSFSSAHLTVNQLFLN